MLHLCPEKWGVRYPQSKKWGYWYPSYVTPMLLRVHNAFYAFNVNERVDLQ